jgi:hypothetical protein
MPTNSSIHELFNDIDALNKQLASLDSGEAKIDESESRELLSRLKKAQSH